MPGNLEVWPDWPAFTKENAEAGEDLVEIKSSIIDIYGKETMNKSWLKVCKALEVVTDHINLEGSAIISEMDYHEILALRDEKKRTSKVSDAS
jgi:hypothetical protein